MSEIIKIFLILFLVISYNAKGQEDYFPPNIWLDDEYNQVIVNWYSKHLVVMKEPSLWKLSSETSKEVYRFLWLRTFHEPVSIRLEIEYGQNAKLIVKQTDGKGGYEAGKMIINDTVQVTKEDLIIFYSFIDSLDYWNLPVNPEPDWQGFDGAQWIIEGIKNKKYHLVDIWTPEENIYKRLGLYLIKLSKLKPEEIY